MTPETWAACRAWLSSALRPEDGDEASLRAEILSGRAQLWAGEAGALVTQCVESAEGRSLHVWLAGGRLDTILALRPGVEAWARGLGCAEVTIEGRNGWARVLGAHGYRRHGEILRRSL
ncbi:hypothetical protein [Phenylobacterium sp.]|uniref:hypothetical protein n=1 Tax=Phenylobacterium sp. TaxID=1871053 RepID=UPI00272F2976|nr:hypothetical protein [Phenylobacterium sp.]MDP1616776.1 hypothetical protein [Phenylobacterium sp.]MDP1988278.1 hypothetical protein [Phenylobacterium sp.]